MDIKKVKNYQRSDVREGESLRHDIVSISCSRADSPFLGKMLSDEKIWTCERRQQGSEGAIKRVDDGGWRKKSKCLQLYKSWDLNRAQKAIHHSEKRPRWGWKVKGLSYVRRSPRSQGTNLTSPRVRRDEGKPSLLSARSRPMGFQSVAIDHIPGKKRLSGPGVTPWLFSILHPEW